MMNTISAPWIKICAYIAPFILPKFDRVNYTFKGIKIKLPKTTEEINYKQLKQITITNPETLTLTLSNGVVKYVIADEDDILIDINSILY